jgi:hypothetical protein
MNFGSEANLNLKEPPRAGGRALRSLASLTLLTFLSSPMQKPVEKEAQDSGVSHRSAPPINGVSHGLTDASDEITYENNPSRVENTTDETLPPPVLDCAELERLLFDGIEQVRRREKVASLAPRVEKLAAVSDELKEISDFDWCIALFTNAAAIPGCTEHLAHVVAESFLTEKNSRVWILERNILALALNFGAKDVVRYGLERYLEACSRGQGQGEPGSLIYADDGEEEDLVPEIFRSQCPEAFSTAPELIVVQIAPLPLRIDCVEWAKECLTSNLLINISSDRIKGLFKESLVGNLNEEGEFKICCKVLDACEELSKSDIFVASDLTAIFSTQSFAATQKLLDLDEQKDLIQRECEVLLSAKGSLIDDHFGRIVMDPNLPLFTRITVLECLGGEGRLAFTAIAPLLENPDNPLFELAVWALRVTLPDSERVDTACAAFLLKVGTENPSPNVKNAVASILGTHPLNGESETARQKLFLEFIKSGVWEHQRNTVRGLFTGLDAETGIENIRVALPDLKYGPRAAAYEALIALGQINSVPGILKEMRNDPDPEVQVRALALLAYGGMLVDAPLPEVVKAHVPGCTSSMHFCQLVSAYRKNPSNPEGLTSAQWGGIAAIVQGQSSNIFLGTQTLAALKQIEMAMP